MAKDKVGYKNPPKETRFKKGDPRINRKGRPKNFDALRELTKNILSEVATDAEGNPLVAPDGHLMTTVEVVLRSMVHDRKQRRQALEIAYGKVPEELTIHDDDDMIQVRLVDYRKGLVDDEANGGPEE